MSNFRVVKFAETQEFIDACKSYDDSFMNFPLGSLLDSADPLNTKLRKVDPSSRALLAIYEEEQLTAALIRISDEFPWMLGTPRRVEQHLSSDDISSITSLLAPAIADSLPLKAFDKVVGPERLVNALIDAWVSYANARGVSVKALDPLFTSRISYATLSTIPPPSPAFSHHRVEPVTTQDDVGALAELYLEFVKHGPNGNISVEVAKERMSVFVKLGLVWVCRVDSQLAGYCLVGRTTPRTIAIRNVFVLPSHRRKGIAEAVTRALSRYYLGADPLGFEGAPSPCPDDLVKTEVCINVAEDHVERIYKRCGFLLDTDEPGTGKKGWFYSLFRGVEYLP